MSVLVASAQTPDTALILGHYKFSHVRGTNNREGAFTENMVLFIGKNAGSFKRYDRKLQNELFRRQMQDAKKDVVFKFDRVGKAVMGAPNSIIDRKVRILPPLGDDDDNADPNLIKVPANGIKASDKQLAKLQNPTDGNPNALAQSIKSTAQCNGGPQTDFSIKAGASPALNIQSSYRKNNHASYQSLYTAAKRPAILCSLFCSGKHLRDC